MSQLNFEQAVKAYLEREEIATRMKNDDAFCRYAHQMTAKAKCLDDDIEWLGSLDEPDFSWCENQYDLEYTRDAAKCARDDRDMLRDFLGEYISTLD